MAMNRLLCTGWIGVVAIATGCAFAPNSAGRTGGATGTGTGASGGGSAAGTGGAPFIWDGGGVSDAPRDFITSVDVPGEVGPTADANCGNLPFEAKVIPPDLLIVLDRSNSMNEDAAGQQNGGANSKWNLMTAAINTAVADTQDSINWGLKFFGTDSACGVTPGAAVAPALNNAAAIKAAIARTTAASYTPTTAGELSAGEYLKTLNDGSPKYILMATDGQPTCGPPNFNSSGVVDDPAAIASVATVAQMGFPTFVIGIATTASATADSTLNQMAVNGGKARVGMTPQYYPVSTSNELVTALRTIKGMATASCTYRLGMPDANADMTHITVTVDGMSIAKGGADGWDYDANMTSITFTGTTCDALLMGTATKVQILYGCKTDIPI